MDRAANILGALALAVSDQIEFQMREELSRGGEAPAALVILGYVPGLSVEVLRQLLRLSHPGTVRLVDRLEADTLVERRKTEDGRSVALHLTAKGKRLRGRLMKRRLNVLDAALASLGDEERLRFGELAARILAGIPETELDKHRICRLCSVQLCNHQCPIPGNAPVLQPYRKD